MLAYEKILAEVGCLYPAPDFNLKTFVRHFLNSYNGLWLLEKSFVRF